MNLNKMKALLLSLLLSSCVSQVKTVKTSEGIVSIPKTEAELKKEHKEKRGYMFVMLAWFILGGGHMIIDNQ